VRLLSRWALTAGGLVRLELPTPVDHHAAVRVAARAGYYREGVLRSYLELHGKRVDVAMWALVRSDLPPHS
jgi:RimJ/RimL family protein N-acetyltransferase